MDFDGRITHAMITVLGRVPQFWSAVTPSVTDEEREFSLFPTLP